MDQKTDFLVPASSFLVGVGSLLNIAGNYFEYNHSSTTSQADLRALSSDWAIVGQDIRHAMSEVDKERLSPDAHGEK
jgi:hypothetical protein